MISSSEQVIFYIMEINTTGNSIKEDFMVKENWFGKAVIYIRVSLEITEEMGKGNCYTKMEIFIEDNLEITIYMELENIYGKMETHILDSFWRDK